MIEVNDIKLTIDKFPNKESRIKINNRWVNASGRAVIKWRFEREDEILYLLFIVDYLKSSLVKEIVLLMPYVPYCRQDRKSEELFTLKTFCNLINSCGFDRVYIENAHSDVTTALIDNVVDNYYDGVLNFFNDLRIELNFTKCHLLSPDMGSLKKTYKIYDLLRNVSYTYPYLGNFIEGQKIRSLKTGDVTGTDIFNLTDLEDDNPILIIDDICDDGDHIIEIAKLLKEQNREREIFFYVSHGFFTKGLDIFDGLIDRIYVYDVFLECIGQYGIKKVRG